MHSTKLAVGLEGGTGPNTRYTVPTGYRTILKGVSAYNTYAGFNRLYVVLVDGSTVVSYLMLPLDANGTLGEAKNETPWQVLNAGEHLATDALHGSVYFWLSGAELKL